MAKKESPIQKIFVGVVVAVVSALLIAYLNGVFTSKKTDPITPVEQSEAVKATQGRG